ncbi:SET domain-containing protein-lysine N-methyltransferase [Roseofilum sp. Guam]|uniref:SET domain-containing protein-lysine N-methyltransferase n=1 Tax=Roseofilum sp. Guam TaxID=2821502 RepID=UPI00298E6731|nr:SET domain-containing protein-lysine N-methyltransferase [Roseofilum sp. Guam]
MQVKNLGCPIVLEVKSVQIAEKITKISSFAEIRECVKTGNKSLHATVEFMPGEVISKFSPKEILDLPNYLTVQISDRQHIMLDPEFLQYINHSCAPNVIFDPTNWVVKAARKIEIGEELSFFYPSTEWSMDRGFDCICESENCLGYIQGASHLPRSVLGQYQLSDYIQKKLGI